MTNHEYFDKCSNDFCNGDCHYCTLLVCKKCSLYEGSLTTDCPNKYVTVDDCNKIYGGKLDYREDEGGWVNKLNPTNQSWLFGSYIRFYGDDDQFVKAKGISYEELIDYKGCWIEKGYDISKLQTKDTIPKELIDNMFDLHDEVFKRFVNNDIAIEFINEYDKSEKSAQDAQNLIRKMERLFTKECEE